MPDIKTKNVVKGTVKTIHKSAVAAERMKDAYIRTKDKAEHGVYSAEGSAEEYAADRISGCADTVTREAVRQFDKQGRRGVQSTKNNISKAKEHFGSGRLKNPLRRWSVAKKRSSRRQNPRVNLQLKRQRVQLRPHRKRLRLPNRPPELRLKRVNASESRSKNRTGFG